ncbi:DUF3015 family protein [Anaeromyxobacter oryzae]|uniref:DUF3015 domain-containing protein n=1 Tax=Anaeromyxobacter oryzae TaxID=2918170 RepID=A0ABN6MVM6_9BACT|nr:DUF3015 family protein [Anaeromyxobacter oryzae]BDG03568.1 hypothetical protein AMOR_25640 [Anaeromyxobacter oryzae]
MRKSLAVAIAAVLFAVPAAAQNKATESAIKGTGRYGTAGCGLGSLAFGNTPGAVQILAATTNSLFGTQTFGITTGTSNCGTGLFAAGTMNFVEANREALAKDISRGQGDAIGALTVINACQDSSAVGAALQKNFRSIFPSETVSNEDVTKAILQTLQAEKSTGCFQHS